MRQTLSAFLKYMPTALIIGGASQDAYYLSHLLLSKKYQVVSTFRQSESADIPDVVARQADLLDYTSLSVVITEFHPQEIYNLAALSLPHDSWSHAALVARVNGVGPVLVMEAIKDKSPQSKFFQASSVHMLDPLTPYAAAKLYAHHMVNIYRQQYHLFAVSGILTNHESPKRPADFVTRRITAAAAFIKKKVKNTTLLDAQGKLILWDLDSPRDMGFAGDFVEAMWLMLQNSSPKDYQIVTGQVHTIKDICEAAFSYVGLNWQDHVSVKSPETRSNRSITQTDPDPIKKDLHWSAKTSFRDLISMMVEEDLKSATDKN